MSADVSVSENGALIVNVNDGLNAGISATSNTGVGLAVNVPIIVDLSANVSVGLIKGVYVNGPPTLRCDRELRWAYWCECGCVNHSLLQSVTWIL